MLQPMVVVQRVLQKTLDPATGEPRYTLALSASGGTQKMLAK